MQRGVVEIVALVGVAPGNELKVVPRGDKVRWSSFSSNVNANFPVGQCPLVRACHGQGYSLSRHVFLKHTLDCVQKSQQNIAEVI